MNNLNSIILEGNLVKNPESKTTPNGHAVTEFSIASNRYFKQNDEMVGEVSYFDIECWGMLAKSCASVLTKGRGVRVVGRLKQDRWEDPKGIFHARVKIVAEHVEFKPVYKKIEDTPVASEEEVEAAIEQEETSDEESLSITGV